MDMQMTNRVPEWVTPVAWVYLGLSLLSAVYLAVVVHAGGRRREAGASGLVWVASALYLGPFAVLAHRRRRQAPEAVVAGLPGGGASAVAHLVGVPLVIASGLTIAGIDLWVMILVIGALAMLLLFVHERVGAGHSRPSVGTAAMVAVLTVLAFDIGMGGWMLLLHFNELMPPATEGSFWFLMQVGIILGLVTGYPVVRWLHSERRYVAPAG